ncbi:hypothetical protein [Candidatus Roseilinea sp. NK_OTU-006]|jgi:hypothetical protein|uniref:hypothetical protein n=1 Tax=Candidatus Roseilinea sp. NK_OTU-006 TaxID=2704250 RepID=UPI00145E1F9D|nr:hypothetical protein [Candidatus Roseilinea sp. NK_OTU-006]
MKPDERSHEYPTRYRYGAQNPAAKLTEAQVAEIKRLLARGAGYRFLAQRYGVSTQTIGAIARGQAWRHVPDPLPQWGYEECEKCSK